MGSRAGLGASINDGAGICIFLNNFGICPGVRQELVGTIYS